MLSLFLYLAIAAAPGAAEPVSGAAEAEESSNQRLICRSRPVLGSRIARQRDCRTAEEWRIYDNDLEASRRDINDRGMRGCTITSCE